METPSSLKKITRSQASIKSQKEKKADSVSRSALSELRNNSPIVGVAMSSLSEKTPKSSASINPAPIESTPGSGESLLRGQVKTLLQKVDEEAEFVNNKSLMEGPIKNETIKVLDPVVPEKKLKIQEESVINRALLFDSPDKTEGTEKISSVSSKVSYQDSEDEEYVEEEEEEYEGHHDESFDDICTGLSKMTVQEEKVELPEFEGKHTRFVYNSDGEIEGEELIVCDKVVSPNAVVLKGFPVPEGKHLRFHEEEEEGDN